MKDGFIKAAAGTPDVRVADCEFNATEIIRMVHELSLIHISEPTRH